jgi:hypothetical protein
MTNRTNSKAVFSLFTGIAVVTVIPVISFLIAPCGFPLALIAGISAVTLGRRSLLETGLTENGIKMARTGVVCGWVGIALNTVIMLIKLAMFVILFVLPAIAIFNGIQSK